MVPLPYPKATIPYWWGHADTQVTLSFRVNTSAREVKSSLVIFHKIINPDSETLMMRSLPQNVAPTTFSLRVCKIKSSVKFTKINKVTYRMTSMRSFRSPRIDIINLHVLVFSGSHDQFLRITPFRVDINRSKPKTRHSAVKSPKKKEDLFLPLLVNFVYNFHVRRRIWLDYNQVAQTCIQIRIIGCTGCNTVVIPIRGRG